jgi:hypothetical protein
MKLNQLPEWLSAPNGGNAAASVKAQTGAAVESVRRELTGSLPTTPEQVSQVTRQCGVKSRETKPGLIETDIQNQSYT